MKHDLIAAAALFLAGALAFTQEPQPVRAQDPERPAPAPEGSRPLPAVEEPYVSPVPRLDLLQRFDRPDPIEGFYELRARTHNGAQDLRPGRGYLVIGKRHLMLYLMGAGPDPAIPQLRASVRRWRRAADSLQLTTLAGHYTEKREVAIEQNGAVEMRRLEVIGGIVRIFQDGQSWLDFARVE